MKYLAFDLEISKLIPEGSSDWKALRPLGISCAATLPEDEDVPDTWVGYRQNFELPYAERMSKLECRELVDYLTHAVKEQGYTILSWNGLAFDFDILAEESGMHVKCAYLALHHVDMMFQVFCLKGHFLGLDKAAQGMGIEGKTAGMNGALAPQLWLDGHYQQVLDYCAQDVRTTLALAKAVETAKQIRWLTKGGHPSNIPIDRWRTVEEALTLPKPNTSWMTNPVERSQFTSWM